MTNTYQCEVRIQLRFILFLQMAIAILNLISPLSLNQLYVGKKPSHFLCGPNGRRKLTTSSHLDIAGIPAVVVPVTLSSNSLPIGLQLIAPGFHERRLLRAAKWLEQQVNFPKLNLS